MLESILMIVTYAFTMALGGFTNYIGAEKKILCLIVIGIGGFIFCWFSPYALSWIGWGSYMTGFLIVFFIGTEDAKKKLQEEILSNFEDERQYITKDGNGNVKINTFKVYSGGANR